MRAESLLASLDVTPSGLPDRAMLVVRQVTWRADRRLPQTARAVVDALRRAAWRPGLGVTPDPAAQAVLFTDEAELLGCLTSDALGGHLDRWYWRRLAPRGQARIGAVLTSAWTERIRWLPAALAALPIADAVRAASTLTDAEAVHLRRALLAEYGVPPTVAVPQGPAPSGMLHLAARRGTATRGGGAAAHERAATPVGAPTATVRPPWTVWLPGVTPALSPAQEALIGVALTLEAAPAVARRPAFVDRVEAWLTAATAGPRRRAWPAPPREGDPRPAERWVPVTPSATAPAPRDAPASPDGPDPTAEPDTAGEGPDPGRPAPVPPHVTIDPRPDRPATPARRPAVRAPGVVPPAPWATGIPSRYASALFLVNLLSWLDLPAAWPPGGDPGGWAILELLARDLIHGDGRAGVGDGGVDDPLWTLLAELDGRELGTAADIRIGPHDPVRLPAAWLVRWTPAPATWVWAERRGRLIVTDSGRGFVVADIPCVPGRGAKAASAEVAGLRAAGVPGSLASAATAPSPGYDPTVHQRWGSVVGRFVAWLLAVREVSTVALAQPGRIAVTRTHVDIVLDLERIDMAARMCGLDRDPGWVPDLGRIVAFHFEAGGQD
jgi:hypothetical protein